MPSHPIVQVLVHGDAWVWLQILLVASVLAPLVEETMFRGVLYRHLRDLTGRWGRLVSILVSASLVSFIFAVIHPQGWAGVPVLMGLAFSFALVREWRGSLLPAMVAHGLNNTLALLLGTLLLRP
jgi:membrane protease YdiL (CAAX protease family)